MTFVHPTLLWALAALSIPILIHLFYFRRYKKVSFSDIRFLHEAKRIQTSSNRLRHLLVLLSRLLAFAAIILAFTQPFFKEDEHALTNSDRVSLFIDNSYSMEAQGRTGSLLRMAKQEAEALVRKAPDYAKFHVFDHTLASEDQRWVTKEQALAKIRETEVYPSSRSIARILGRHRQMLDQLNRSSGGITILTDGQENIFEGEISVDTTQSVSILRFSPVQSSNLIIDSVWFADPVIIPGRSSELYCRVINQSTESRRGLSLLLEVDGQSRPSSSFKIEAAESYIDTLIVSMSEAGWHEISIGIEDDGIQYDDRLNMTVHVQANASVLLIHDGEQRRLYDAVFDVLPTVQMEVTRSDQVVYSSFSDYDLILLDDVKDISSGQVTAFAQYVQGGGSLAIFPSPSTDPTSYNGLLRALEVRPLVSHIKDSIQVTQVNDKSFIFKQVYRRLGRQLRLPQANGYWRLGPRVVAEQDVLLTLRNGQPGLVHYACEGGHLYVSALSTSPKESTLATAGGVFVPMLHRMSLRSTTGVAPYYTIGAPSTISLRSSGQDGDEPYRLTGPSELIPRQRASLGRLQLFIEDEISTSGVYDLQQGTSVEGKVAFVHDRSESKSRFLSSEALSKALGQEVDIIDSTREADVLPSMARSGGPRLITYLLLLALIALGLEQLLLRHHRT